MWTEYGAHNWDRYEGLCRTAAQLTIQLRFDRMCSKVLLFFVEGVGVAPTTQPSRKHLTDDHQVVPQEQHEAAVAKSPVPRNPCRSPMGLGEWLNLVLVKMQTGSSRNAPNPGCPSHCMGSPIDVSEALDRLKGCSA